MCQPVFHLCITSKLQSDYFGASQFRGVNRYPWITWLAAANNACNFRDRKLYLQYKRNVSRECQITHRKCTSDLTDKNIKDKPTTLVTPSEFKMIKVPESNDPVSLLIHSSSILQSSYNVPPLILHLASPVLIQDDL